MKMSLTPADIEGILPAIIDRDDDQLFEWLTSRVRYHGDAHFVLGAFASTVASFARASYARDHPDPVEHFWGALPSPGMPDYSMSAVQLVTATLNDDELAMHAHIDATLGRGAEYSGKVAVALAHMIAGAADSYRKGTPQ